MKEVKITEELLMDFADMIENFNWFLSLNIIHISQHSTGEKKKILEEFAYESRKLFKQLNGILKLPVKNYSQANKKMLEKNLQNIMTTIYQYFQFAEPRLKKYRKDVYDGRYSVVKKRYTDFTKKYLY